MKIQFTMPRTPGGRAMTALLVIVGVVVVVFFFAAVLVVAAVGVLVWFLRSLLAGTKSRRAIRPDEVSAKYEVVENDAETQNGPGERLLSGSPAPESPESDSRSG